jgi:two-component system, OmpR family, response regulator
MMNNMATNNKSVVLLVEDEQDTADLVKLVMEEEGYHVIHTTDGSEAINSLAFPRWIGSLADSVPNSRWQKTRPIRG